MAPRATVPVYLMARAGESPDGENSTLNPTIVAGIILAAVIAVGLATWLAIRWYRKRASAKLAQQSASLNASSDSYDDVYGTEKLSSSGHGAPNLTSSFSRHLLSGGNVVMPERAVIRPGASRDEILEHYTAEGKLPRPFAPLLAPPPSSLTPDGMSPGGRPLSTASWSSRVMSMSMSGSRASNRMSTMSALSATSSLGSPAQKKVRQVFDPVLPDEIVVSLGETLTVVQRHDDGWCIVGRDSVFKPGEVELGAVPAWCFLKPVKGLRAERPMRVSSLGVTVNVDAPRADRWENVLSWSNF